MTSDPITGTSFGLGLVELLVVLALYVVGILVFYFVIRLAVRHGTLDAWKRLPGGPGGSGAAEQARGPGRH